MMCVRRNPSADPAVTPGLVKSIGRCLAAGGLFFAPDGRQLTTVDEVTAVLTTLDGDQELVLVEQNEIAPGSPS